MKRIYFKIEEMIDSIRNISEQLTKSNFDPEVIISINRGGCVPGVYLSHAINVPHKVIDVQLRDEKNKPNLEILENSLISYSNILIIDDINDTGATLKLIERAVDKKEIKIYFASLIENNSSAFKVDFRGKIIDKSLNPSWIVFPWEKYQSE